MNFIDNLKRQLTQYFNAEPEMEVIHCPVVEVDSIHLKYVNNSNPDTQEIGVNLVETFDLTGYMIEVYVLENGSYDFFKVKELEGFRLESPEFQEDRIKTIIRLMRDEPFFNSLKK